MFSAHLYVFPFAFVASSLMAAEPPHRIEEHTADPRMAVGMVDTQSVWVAARRLYKGARVTCADLRLERRPSRQVPQSALPAKCDIAAGAVARHERLPREVVRRDDIGVAPDVAAGSRVYLRVSTSGINVITDAVALSDAMKGEWLQVRLQRPSRTLRARVVEPGLVELEGTPQ
jgi:flagella basal body P-ring formation protein FlgA